MMKTKTILLLLLLLFVSACALRNAENVMPVFETLAPTEVVQITPVSPQNEIDFINIQFFS